MNFGYGCRRSDGYPEAKAQRTDSLAKAPIGQLRTFANDCLSESTIRAIRAAESLSEEQDVVKTRLLQLQNQVALYETFGGAGKSPLRRVKRPGSLP